jgi:hypothetical protein
MEIADPKNRIYGKRNLSVTEAQGDDAPGDTTLSTDNRP